MTQEEIKRHRVESVLKEIIPEALSSLDDPEINSLSVTEVICSKGRSDARVYIDTAFVNSEDEEYILRKLNAVSRYVQNHCKQSEGWFRAPNMVFEFDHQADKINKIEALFKKIESEMKVKDEE
jgi:ribosome-binding factor A